MLKQYRKSGRVLTSLCKMRIEEFVRKRGPLVLRIDRVAVLVTARSKFFKGLASGDARTKQRAVGRRFIIEVVPLLPLQGLLYEAMMWAVDRGDF